MQEAWPQLGNVLSLLKTLDPKEVRSGTAEVIKYGTVYDKALFEYLEEDIEDLKIISKLDLKMNPVGGETRYKRLSEDH